MLQETINTDSKTSKDKTVNLNPVVNRIQVKITRDVLVHLQASAITGLLITTSQTLTRGRVFISLTVDKKLFSEFISNYSMFVLVPA